MGTGRQGGEQALSYRNPWIWANSSFPAYLGVQGLLAVFYPPNSHFTEELDASQ